MPNATAIYPESNVFIYAVEGTDEAAAPAKKLLSHIRAARPGGIVTSEITIAEVLAPAAREGALEVHLKRRIYLDLLVFSRIVELIPVSRDILIETADLRKQAKLKLPDAIHVVSAIRAGCRYVVSNDRHLDRLPQGMTRINPDMPGIDRLLEKIA